MTSVQIPQQQPLSLDLNNNTGSKKNYEKYSLRPRSIQKRIETEKRATEPKKVPKPKQKPPALSKYRRKTANARERTRMKEINVAFDDLQRVVPQYPILPVNAQGKTCEKLTKITTLRLAMQYISSLNRMLKGNDAEAASSSASTSSFSLIDEDPFSTLSPSGSSGSSASSTSDFSPISHAPSPDCIQTVMRSVVHPRNSTRNNLMSTRSTSYQHYAPTMQYQNPVGSYLPSLSASFPNKVPAYASPYNLPKSTPLPPMKYMNQSVSSILAECRGGTGRAGSLSSLTESDLSEYASDLLSDEGSTLDDPMFDDIIGVVGSVGGTVDDLDHLILESDGDSLHFSSELSDS